MAGDCASVSESASIDHHEHEHSSEVRCDAVGEYHLDFSTAATSGPVESALNVSDYQHLSPIRLEDVPIFHSHPTAEQKIYLDFNGHRVSRTGWNEYHDGRTIFASAFDRDGDPQTFDGAEQRAIELIWSRVAEDFAPFEIDVTTESPSARDFSDGKKAIRVLISSNVDQISAERWFENVGGVGYVNSWKFQSDTPVWVFSNVLNGNEKRIAEATSHELGHAFGLDHDGTHVDEYFSGFGDGETSWGPIMGSSSGRAVTQWSQGEYVGASNAENDIFLIASDENEIDFRDDDHSSTFYAPTELRPDSTGTFQTEGLISTAFDRDVFLIEKAAGPLHLEVHGARIGSNLDIQLTLYDSDVNILGTFNPQDDLSASIQADLPAGTYYARIDGVGLGDPKSDGYSEYGSVGEYVIHGTTQPTIDTSQVAQPPIESGVETAQPDFGPFSFGDFLLLADVYGNSVPPSHQSDLNSDGTVDFRDFLILGKHYRRVGE